MRCRNLWRDRYLNGRVLSRFLSSLALVWPGDLPIPRAPPRSSPTEGTFSGCLNCGWRRHDDERVRLAACDPELALRNESPFGTPLPATSLALATFELPICGEGRAPPSESRATQDLRGYERTGLATRFTLLTVTLLSRSLNSPLAQCARGHKIGPVRVVMSSNQRNVRPPFRKILFFNSRCTHFRTVQSRGAVTHAAYFRTSKEARRPG